LFAIIYFYYKFTYFAEGFILNGKESTEMRTNYWNKVLVLMVVGAMALAGAAQAQIHTEDFESGYNLGQNIGSHEDWYDGDAGPTVNSEIGVAGSVGLSNANNIFNWTAHPFNWNEVTKVIIGMDFQTDGSSHFDDDRCGWTINSGSVNSADFFGTQLDHPDGGIVTYWRNSSGSRVQTLILAFGDLKASTWYRFRNEMTKLTSTSARIDISLVELDVTGNPIGSPLTGTVEDTSVWPGGAPDNKYFTASNIWPAYKNYSALEGAADNAYFEIVPAGPVPTVTLVSPADESLVKTTEVSFTCSATSEDGLQEAALYVGEVPVTITFSGADDTDDAQLYATDDSATPEVEGPDTNAGTAATINVDGDNPHAHAVIKFLNVFGDENGQVPLGSTIISATLKVNCFNFGALMQVYRVTSDWSESTVTWKSPWTSPGGDYDDTVVVDGDCTATGLRTIDITEFVQAWSDEAANFGIVLTDSGGNDGIDFYSSESGSPPVLTITYGSDFELKETQPMSGTSDTVTFGPITLADEQDHVWNCLVTNVSSEQSWAPADFHLTVNTQCPDEPVVVQPTDDATDVSTSPELVVTASDPQGDLMDVTFYGRGGASGDEFTIVVLPDTQNYCEFPENAHIFTEQTQWIVDNIGTRNIVFVTHEGDIVENPGSTTEYDRARSSMSVLDPGLADLSDPILPDPYVPYGVCPGNHDQPTGPPPSGYYNEYFPYTHYESRELDWYGGHWPATGNDNNYQLFSAGGMDFVILHLEYNPGSDVITWADQVLYDHADRMAIITTHAYLNVDGSRRTDGGAIWDTLVQQNDNVYFVLCGHMQEEARRTDVVNGREVHQILADYQGRPNGGNGWLRIMRFVPAEDTVYVDTYSPWLEQYETDGDSQFTLNLPMNFYEEIGTNTGVASGSNASVVWSDLLPGKEHEWFVEVTDTAEHTQVGPTWSSTTIDNQQQASNPSPVNGGTGVDIEADLSWTAGEGAASHDVHFGTDPPPPPGFPPVVNQTDTTYDPGTLEEGITYYWRIDEKNEAGTTIGTVWSFTTYIPAPEIATPNRPVNPNGTAVDVPDVKVGISLRWFSGDRAASHDVYLGINPVDVNNADNTSPEFKGNILQEYGDPVEGGVLFTTQPGVGDLPYDSSYYWRIDEINPGGTTKGNIWNFTTESDTYPPNFTYLGAGSITAHEATITWTTNELSDSLVEYGLDESYGSSVYDGNEVTLHSVTLTGLQPGTEYFYRATSTDQAEPGNSATEYPIPPFFTTLENTPPVAVNDSATTTEGVAVLIDVLVNDSDADGDTLTVESVTFDPAKATVETDGYTVTYTPLLAAPYTDTFQYDINDGYFGTATATVTVDVIEPFVDYVAYGEIAVLGTVTGSYIDTQAKDGSYEVIEEMLDKPNKNAASLLEHKWLIDVPGTGPQSLHVNAYRDDSDSADDFVFAYSTDDLTYTNMLTVTKTADDGMYQTYALPDSISGTVYISLSDTHHENKELVIGQVYVDHLFIRCESAGVPDTTAPTPDPMTWASAPQATGSTSISMTATTASDPSGVEYYFACINDPAHDSGWQDSPVYDDTGLTTGIEYTYQIKARDKSPNQNETGWSPPASATPTDVPPAAPTGLLATPGDSQVSLDWNDNTEPDLDGYNVYRSETSGSYGAPLAFVTESAYVDNDVVNGTTYYYVVTAVDLLSNESDNSNEASATPGSQSTVYVENIFMGLVPAGINWKGAANVQISVYQANATVIGDWYLGSTGTTADQLLESGATGLTDAGGLAVVISVPIKAKSGEYFTFVVTDVILTGYVFDPGQGITENSIIVP
jgi:hypothetical protein